MRSEKEIREEINRLLIAEKEAVSDMKEAANDDNPTYLDIYIERANIVQHQRAVLEWVLNENNI